MSFISRERITGTRGRTFQESAPLQVLECFIAGLAAVRASLSQKQRMQVILIWLFEEGRHRPDRLSEVSVRPDLSYKNVTCEMSLGDSYINAFNVSFN